MVALAPAVNPVTVNTRVDPLVEVIATAPVETVGGAKV